MNQSSSFSHPLLSRTEKTLLGFFAALLLLFGGIVEIRSAFLRRHMTDLGVYLRAGWAIRAGEDIYEITDDNHWHYQYPPLFAILMTPLADPPMGSDRQGMIPFGLSAGLWYGFSLACLCMSVHVLASALEQTSANPRWQALPRGCRRWWGLRILPVLICLGPVGHTLMRGQVNLLLLALLCGMASALLRRQSGRAGLWLASAICLKIIPAFLLLIPFWRRDARFLVTCCLGLIVGFALIPTLVFGPSRTVQYYEEYAKVLLGPALGRGDDQSRAKELIDITASDSQSLLAVFHNILNPVRATRPPRPSPAVRGAQFVVGTCLTLATFLALGLVEHFRRLRKERGFLKEILGAPEELSGTQGPASVMFLGCLVLVMLLLSPVCHLHYFCLSLILVMGLLAQEWENQDSLRLPWPLVVVFVLQWVANLLPSFPGLEVLRDMGVATAGALLLWTMGCLALWRQTKRSRDLVIVAPRSRAA